MQKRGKKTNYPMKGFFGSMIEDLKRRVIRVWVGPRTWIELSRSVQLKLKQDFVIHGRKCVSNRNWHIKAELLSRAITSPLGAFIWTRGEWSHTRAQRRSRANLEALQMMRSADCWPLQGRPWHLLSQQTFL